ncbi:hypothetical protein HMPREF1548_06585 [Clostridium sp. KLE 1755]|nr:hypothetical protein HMPREF1548_06585 [Clostridium sp. KLE 1755]
MYLLYIYVAIFSIAFIYFIQIICVTHICYNFYVVIAVVLKEFHEDRLLQNLCGITDDI